MMTPTFAYYLTLVRFLWVLVIPWLLYVLIWASRWLRGWSMTGSAIPMGAAAQREGEPGRGRGAILLP